MPRFVVHHHTFDDGDEHWDLMFEVGDVLWTWSLPVPPDLEDRLPVSARQLPDHRAAYLDYEGPVSRDRGRVRIHDRGIYRWVCDEDIAEADMADVLQFQLDGERAHGRYRLLRAPHDGIDLWRLREFA